MPILLSLILYVLTKKHHTNSYFEKISKEGEMAGKVQKKAGKS